MPEQKACPDPAVKPKKNRIVRAVLMVAGTISLVFAAIGVVLPLIPTTPFLLLAVACYCRSSERLYMWLINNRWFGEYIRNYREGKGIPLKTKVVALTVMWATISIT
ncbi:MAG TPA: YbaN family protein, partial [Candidatus Bathyarchaeia archaeon]|nr:YbaN family protein [Candidatus Bathyarchaeia archaeon]